MPPPPPKKKKKISFSKNYHLDKALFHLINRSDGNVFDKQKVIRIYNAGILYYSKTVKSDHLDISYIPSYYF